MILYREVKRGGDEVKSLASSQSFKTSWSTLKYAQNLLMQNLHFSDMKPKTSDFCNEVLLGFSKPQKAIHLFRGGFDLEIGAAAASFTLVLRGKGAIAL
jgi:hypothetical protein